MYKMNIRMFFRSVFLLFFLFPVICEAKIDLFQTDEWLALGHYQKNLFGGYESTIDTANFFLSETGKFNPQNEFEATIALFQSNDYEKQCLFPARYKLLKKYNLTKAVFPKCKEYDQFYRDLRPNGITLLFTDANMNNPSSLFGHTMIRIDTARKGTQLLGHGITYGAFMGNNPGPFYPLLGLTGAYFGGFTVKPYYEVVNNYNNIENRDVWEVNLNFSREELDYFIAHMWEVGQAQSRYYFLTRNCSYLLLENLDAVRPSLKLAQKFPLQVIPLDTMKALQSIPDINKGVNYRPSRQSKIRHRYKMMNKMQKQVYLQAIKDHDYFISGLKDDEKADVLETAYQYVQYQYIAGKSDLSEYRKESFALLKERNKLKEKGNIEDLTWNDVPMLGHDSMRAAIGNGWRNGEAFQQLSWRPAYHSWTDDGYGFVKGAEINFLETSLRYYNNQDKLVLQNLNILSLKSISPIDAMFAPVSFQILWNIGRDYNPKNNKEGYITTLKTGGGATVRLTDEIMAYTLINGVGGYGGFLDKNVYAAMSGEAGFLAVYDKWRLWAKAEKIYASIKWKSQTVYYGEGTYNLSRNWALAASYKYEQNYGRDVEESLLGVRHYF